MKKGPPGSRRGEIGGPSCVRAFPPEGGLSSGRTRALLKPFRAEPAASRRRPPQRPGLRCGADAPPDRRSRTTATNVGGLPRRRPGTRVPSETTRSGARSSAWRGASGSAKTCAIQPSRGVLDCMAETKHQTAYRTVKAPDADPNRSMLVPALSWDGSRLRRLQRFRLKAGTREAQGVLGKAAAPARAP